MDTFDVRKYITENKINEALINEEKDVIDPDAQVVDGEQRAAEEDKESVEDDNDRTPEERERLNSLISDIHKNLAKNISSNSNLLDSEGFDKANFLQSVKDAKDSQKYTNGLDELVTGQYLRYEDEPTNPQIRNAYDIYVDDIITAYFHKKLLNDANSISYDQVSSLLKVITNILNPINLDTSKKVKGISNSIKWYNDNENPGYTWDPSEMGVDFNIK